MCPATDHLVDTASRSEGNGRARLVDDIIECMDGEFFPERDNFNSFLPTTTSVLSILFLML